MITSPSVCIKPNFYHLLKCFVSYKNVLKSVPSTGIVANVPVFGFPKNNYCWHFLPKVGAFPKMPMSQGRLLISTDFSADAQIVKSSARTIILLHFMGCRIPGNCDYPLRCFCRHLQFLASSKSKLQNQNSGPIRQSRISLLDSWGQFNQYLT